MTAPMNANDVSRYLIGLARDLDAAVRQLETSEREAVDKRHDADLAEAKAYLAAEGPVEMRKRLALIACERQEHEAQIAEAVVRHLRRHIAAIGTRIDVGRTYSAAIRSEIALGGVS